MQNVGNQMGVKNSNKRLIFLKIFLIMRLSLLLPQGQHYRRKWFQRQMPTHMADIRRDWLTNQNTDWCFVVIGLSTQQSHSPLQQLK